MITVLEAAGLVLVQDAGRPGYMHQGVPPGGPLVPELLARANRAANNAPGVAALEIFGAVTLEARTDGVVVAASSGERRALAVGERWRVACEGARVTYAAVRGGIAVPEVLGGRGTLPVAQLGGHEGRALRRGDVLTTGDAPEEAGPMPAVPDATAVIEVVLGPDGPRFAAEATQRLLDSEFRVSTTSDRMGIRLVGPPLPRADADDGRSTPMVRGAIQVPALGEPIVLGPDHPTMGGYPCIATVTRPCFGGLAVRPPGSVVRFAAVRPSGGRGLS
ncbi:MAG: biotin-dependent carboxyltransferase family protein [Polyangiaceae bacterium]